MIVYHGTTVRRARKIAVQGFVPRRPSRRVWFAGSRAYARGRARTQARRAHDRPAVLTCDIDLAHFRQKYGSKRMQRSSIVTIDGPVPADVLLSCGEPLAFPSSPKDLADWVNDVLGLKSYKGVGQRHPGIVRLSRWVANRAADPRRRGIKRTELLAMARQFLPDYFRGVEIDPDRLIVVRRLEMEGRPPQPPAAEIDPREEEALELLERGRPRHTIRALALLAEIEDPDLFEWCSVCLADASAEVRLAALRTLQRCRDIDAETIEPFVDARDNRIRAAAIAALARHAPSQTARAGWFERGLKDPSACVRLETAHVLPALDPTVHRAIFRLALCDPNPQVAALADKLVTGKGFPKITWGVGPSHYGDAPVPAGGGHG
jgi:hypothetical protein